MKKSIVFILSALILLGASVNANAQHFIVKGGVAYANGPKVSNVKDYDFKGYTGWMAGIGYQVGNFAGFSIQPELLYKVKGVNLEDAGKIKMNYLEIPVNIQFGPDLLIARPYVIAAPFIGFNLANSLSKESITLEAVKNSIEKVEYGFGLGAGLDVWKLQLAFKYNWNFGHVLDLSGYLSNLKNIDAAKGGFELTIGLKF
jgi:Opacity protein and related surface antigens